MNDRNLFKINENERVVKILTMQKMKLFMILGKVFCGLALINKYFTTQTLHQKCYMHYFEND